MNRKDVENEIERAYYGSHDLETIRNLALRMKCGKLDMDFVRDVKTKQQLVEYLIKRDCPALKLLILKTTFVSI